MFTSERWPYASCQNNSVAALIRTCCSLHNIQYRTYSMFCIILNKYDTKAVHLWATLHLPSFFHPVIIYTCFLSCFQFISIQTSILFISLITFIPCHFILFHSIHSIHSIHVIHFIVIHSIHFIPCHFILFNIPFHSVPFNSFIHLFIHSGKSSDKG